MRKFYFYRFDEEKWDNLFLAHSEIKKFKYKVEKAKDKILDAFKKHPKWHIAFSGGKIVYVL